jgi:hypothetical protein
MTTRFGGRLTGAALALGLAALAGRAAAECPAGAPEGVFKGKTAAAGANSLEVMLNLVCADGRYRGQIFTSQGDFTVVEAVGAPGRVVLELNASAPVRRLELTLAGETLTGSLGPAAGGRLALVHTGPGLALDALDPTLNLTPAQWRDDLEAFRRELPARHANAFFRQPKPEFDAALDRLERRLGALDADETFTGLERITKAVGDGHTGVNLPADRRTLPIRLARFGKDLRVVAAGPGLERALGARVVRIGRLSADEAWSRVLTLSSQDELPELRDGEAVNNLRSGLLLHGLGIIPDRGHAVFALRDDAGRTFSLDVRGVALGEPVPPMTRAAPATGLAQQDADKPFWCRELPENHAIYCAFHGYQNLGRGALDMFALIEKTHPGKLIVDMRNNGGGDNTLGYAFLIKPLEGRADLNQKGRLYVLVGALTFSAAMNNAAQFQDETKAILVGQQIGEKPNSYQEPRQFRLPNSHLIIRASSLYYQFRKQGPNAVTPDKTIVPSWDDVKAGRDPVLDWVLAQPTP